MTNMTTTPLARFSHGGMTATMADDGGYTLDLPGFRLEGCRAEVRGDDGRPHPLPWRATASGPEGLELACANDLGDWFLSFRPVVRAGRRGLSVRMRGRTSAFRREISLRPLTVPALALDRLLAQGLGPGHCLSTGFPARGPREFTGHYFLMLARGGRFLQLAAPLRQALPLRFAGRLGDAGVEDLTIAVDAPHYDRRELSADPVSLFAGDDPFALMTDWADEQAPTRRDFSAALTPGWNSWDYYRWTVTEEAVLENAEFIARDPVLSKRIKRVIIDDGWQYCYGEWTANPMFPRGMRALAAELTRMGFEPGLWFAPGVAEPHSRLAQLDGDMLAQSEGGQPCLGYSCLERKGFLLDPTHNKTRRFLHDLFADYVDMGYRYFKLDFLTQTLKARRFHDRTVSRADIVPRLLEPIRSATAGRASLLGCNYPLSCGADLVDAVRVGSDIHSAWQNIRDNALSVGARFWGGQRLWVNDPDFALCRSMDTSDDPDLHRLRPRLVFVSPESEYNGFWGDSLVDARRPQMEVLLSVALMAGGAVNLSDNLPRLNASGLDLARRVAAAEVGAPATPLDLFENDRPGRWLQKTPTGHRVLLVNWDDAEKDMVFDGAAHGLALAAEAVDFWNDAPVSVENGAIRRRLPGRGCLLATVPERV